MNAAAAQYRKMIDAHLLLVAKDGNKSVDEVRKIRIGLLERIVRDYTA